MANQQGSFLTAIDVGSAKTCALMAEVTDTGLRYRGHGVAESRGSRKGVIVELDKAVAAIQKACRSRRRYCRRARGARHRRHWRSAYSRRQQPRRHQPGHASARNRTRRDQAGRRPRSRHPAARRSRDSPPAAAGVHSRRSGRSARSAGHDGGAPRSASPHGDRRDQRHAERHHRRQQSRSSRRRHRVTNRWPPPIPCFATTSANSASASPTSARARPN